MARRIGSTDALLDLIYDAASEPELWCSVLTSLADATGGQGAALYGLSFEPGKVHFDYNGRMDEECNRVYQERHTENAWAHGMQHRPAGRIVLSDDILPLSSLRRTAFFDEVLKPQDIAHNAMVSLFAENDFRVAFNLCRSERQGPLPKEGRELLAGLIPHMRRSVTLGFRFDAYRALQKAEFFVLDRLTAGVVLLDVKGRILYLNAAARRFASEEGALSLSGGIPAPRSILHRKPFENLVGAAQQGKAGGAMSLPNLSDGRLLTVIVASVRSRDIDRFADRRMPDASVLVFISDPAQSADFPLSRIRDAYNLTAAEAKVALAAASGASIFHIAELLEVSENTVKTHLRRIYMKTGTNRQAELARIVHSFSLIKAP